MQEVKRKILIVDDEDAILFAFSIILRQADLEVHTAQTLSEALILLKENEYRAILADLRLSGTTSLDGYSVVNTASQTQKECTIIVMTAFGDENIKEKVFALGADYYFEKPVSPQKVKELMISLGIYRV